MCDPIDPYVPQTEHAMRLLTIPLLVAVLAAGTAFAQQHEQGKNPFTQEEGKKLQETQKDLSEAFQYKDYATGLKVLREQMPILERALARIEAGEVDLGDQVEMWKKLLTVGRDGFPYSISTNWYNQACCLSMTGEKPGALDALAKAIEYGYLDVDHMKLDDDLAPLREEAAYKKLLAELDYNEEIVFYAPEGLTAAPILVVLHSASGNEEKALETWKALGDKLKAVIAVPRGPIKLAKGRFDWKRHSADEAEALKKVKFAIAAAKAKYPDATGKVFLVGEKIGGYFASLSALMSPGEIAGAIPLNAYWNKYYFEDFLAKAKEKGLKICLIHGKDDPAFGRVEAAVTQLTEAGIAVKLFPFDGGKELPENAPDLVNKAILWMGR